jgi:hypothetical protein
MSYPTSRRTFLKAVGTACATMPFVRLLERSALGDPASGPTLRFVGVRHGNGRPTEFWRPTAGFGITGPNQSLQPFDDAATYGTSFKNNLIVIDGIQNTVANESNSGGHASTPCIWTGSINSPSGPQCESIETFLGVTNGLGNDTLFPTTLYGPSAAYAPSGTLLDSITNPQWLFSTLFAKLIPSNLSPQDQAAATARGKSTLDFITSSLTGLQNRLASPEKTLLDQHLTAIRQIENRLVAPAPSCPSVPTMPASASTVNGDYVNQTVLSIITQAIACDLTRFLQITLSDPGSQIGSTAQDPGVVPPLPAAYPPSGMTCSDSPNASADCDHLDVAHKYVASSPFTLGGGGAPSDVTSQIRLARLNKYYMSQLASFMQQLKQYSLLDNTLIMTMTDVGNPALHDCSGIPVLLLGGANGYFKMGQNVVLPALTPQNAVLVSVANAFGVPITKYGVSSNASTLAGPLPGLTA